MGINRKSLGFYQNPKGQIAREKNMNKDDKGKILTLTNIKVMDWLEFIRLA